MLKVITEYPIIDNGKVIDNASRCGEKCSSDAPFIYQKGEYSNASGGGASVQQPIIVNTNEITRQKVLVGVMIVSAIIVAILFKQNEILTSKRNIF